MDFAPEQQLNASEAEAIARGLYAIAQADGVHAREAALIASFWADTGAGAVALADLAKRPAITAGELAQSLASADTRRLFVKTSLLLAYADGKVTPAERAIVASFAKALAVAGDEVDHMETQVKEFLLSHLTHLQNSASAVAVAKKLGI